MPSLAASRCLFRLMRHCFLGRWICLPVSERFRQYPFSWSNVVQEKNKPLLYLVSETMNLFNVKNSRDEHILRRPCATLWHGGMSNKYRKDFRPTTGPRRTLAGRVPWYTDQVGCVLVFVAVGQGRLTCVPWKPTICVTWLRPVIFG